MSPNQSAELAASVIVRCLNEANHLGHLLLQLEQQTLSNHEVIVVDSGSTDGTVEIAERFGARILNISPKDFSFGRSLNLGCSKARGEFLVMISAHCFPARSDWLVTLIAPFADPDVAVSYGKQRGSRLTQFSEHQIFKKWFPDQSSPDQDGPFSNNANCAIRRSLWEDMPYDEDLPGLEDIAWAKEAQAKGFKVAYSAEAPVIHEHDETRAQTRRRYRREAIALQELYPGEHFNLWNFAKLTTRNITADLSAARLNGGVGRAARDIIGFRIAQFWGTYRGFHTRWPGPSELKKHLYYPEE